MKKSILQQFAIGFFIAGCLLLVYWTFIYQAPTQKANAAEVTKITKDRDNYKKKYEQLLLDTEVSNMTSDSSKTETKTETKPTVVTYKLKIESGEMSSSVVDTLYKNKIITDKDKFTKFLADKKYETKIRDGNYTVKSDMSFDDLAKIITMTK